VTKVTLITGTSNDGRLSNKITNDMRENEKKIKKVISNIEASMQSVKDNTKWLIEEKDETLNDLKNNDQEIKDLEVAIQRLDTKVKLAGIGLNSSTSKDDVKAGINSKIIHYNKDKAMKEKELKTKENNRISIRKIENKVVSTNDDIIKENEIKLNGLKRDLTIARSKQDSLVREIESKTNEKIQDAYSVYGKFNSNGGFLGSTGSKTTIEIGKVFSTGVAAQHISKGIRDRAVIESIIACMKKVKEIVGDTTSRADLKICENK